MRGEQYWRDCSGRVRDGCYKLAQGPEEENLSIGQGTGFADRNQQRRGGVVVVVVDDFGRR